MPTILLVGLGGFLGAASRYALSKWVQDLVRNDWLPYGTLAVNTLGSLVLGLLIGLAEARGLFSPDSRAFLFIGLLGGFTTFSTFSVETFALLRDGQAGAALLNVALQLGLGLGAAWLGYAVAQSA